MNKIIQGFFMHRNKIRLRNGSTLNIEKKVVLFFCFDCKKIQLIDVN